MVSYAGGDDWRIVTVRCANPHLSVSATEASRGSGQATYRVVVRLDKQAPSGYLADHAVLVTNDPRSREVAVPIEGVVQPRIALTPDWLFMGAVEPGQKVTKQLVLCGKEPFRVTEATCDRPGFTIATQDGASDKRVHLVSVTFEAGKAEGKTEGSIQRGHHDRHRATRDRPCNSCVAGDRRAGNSKTTGEAASHSETPPATNRVRSAADSGVWRAVQALCGIGTRVASSHLEIAADGFS